MEISAQDQFNELSFFTLAHPDMISFIHQHIVDAHQAQMANEKTKPVAITFSLVGLYLFLEKNFTGRQVQLAHMKLSQNKKTWPTFELPMSRGAITVSTVLQTAPGEERDSMIKEWCKSVWQAYSDCHETVVLLVKKELGV